MLFHCLLVSLSQNDNLFQICGRIPFWIGVKTSSLLFPDSCGFFSVMKTCNTRIISKVLLSTVVFPHAAIHTTVKWIWNSISSELLVFYSVCVRENYHTKCKAKVNPPFL